MKKSAADTLTQSVPNNMTSEMGLALLDVADAIRPYPEVIKYLQHVKDEHFLDELVKFVGGQKTETRSMIFSRNTAYDVAEKSILRNLVGANNQ